MKSTSGTAIVLLLGLLACAKEDEPARSASASPPAPRATTSTKSNDEAESEPAPPAHDAGVSPTAAGPSREWLADQCALTRRARLHPTPKPSGDAKRDDFIAKKCTTEAFQPPDERREDPATHVVQTVRPPAMVKLTCPKGAPYTDLRGTTTVPGPTTTANQDPSRQAGLVTHQVTNEECATFDATDAGAR